MRAASLVLLQTVPEGLGACELRAAALRVPGVLAIHELHVWQLHRDHVVATAHIAYNSHEVNIFNNYYTYIYPLMYILVIFSLKQPNELNV